MNLFVLGDIFSGLLPWFISGSPPKGMPAVYNFFQYFGHSTGHRFEAIVVNPYVSRVISFENGSKIHLYKIPVKNRILFRLLCLPISYIYALKHIRKGNFDVIYGMANYSLVASLLGKQYAKTTVCRVFGSLASDFVKKKKYSKVFSRHLLEYLTARFGRDILISTNDGTQYDALVEFAGRKGVFYHLYNGIDQTFHQKLGSLPPVVYTQGDMLKILSIGRLSHWKRHDLALESIRILVQKYKLNAHLEILGDGPDKSKLEARVKELGLEEFVTITPAQQQSGYLEALQRSHVCLFCYDNSNLGNSLWEAVYAGRLIAVRNTGDTGNIFSHKKNSLVGTEEDFPEDIAEKINAWIQLDLSSTQELIEGARSDISRLILPWPQRFETEIRIISDYKLSM